MLTSYTITPWSPQEDSLSSAVLSIAAGVGGLKRYIARVQRLRRRPNQRKAKGLIHELKLTAIQLSAGAMGNFGSALEAQLLHFVVVVLAVEDLPLLRSFEDDLALR